MKNQIVLIVRILALIVVGGSTFYWGVRQGRQQSVMSFAIPVIPENCKMENHEVLPTGVKIFFLCSLEVKR